MDEQNLPEPKALPAHKYPLWIKLFAGVVLLAVLYSLFLLPKYFMAAKQMKVAKTAYKAADYNKAEEYYRKVLEAMPSSDPARIGFAETIFANSDKNDDDSAMLLLNNVDINDKDWERIIKVMPTKYQEYFEEINTK